MPRQDLRSNNVFQRTLKLPAVTLEVCALAEFPHSPRVTDARAGEASKPTSREAFRKRRLLRPPAHLARGKPAALPRPRCQHYLQLTQVPNSLAYRFFSKTNGLGAICA